MSFLTATNTELIYNMEASGADYAVSVTKTTLTPLTTSGVQPAYLPPVWSIWQPSTIPGKGFRIVLAGTYDTGAALNMTFNYGQNTTQASTTFVTNGTLFSTGAFPLPTSAAGSWYMQVDITFASSMPTSGGGVLQGYVNGFVAAGAGNNAAAAAANVGMIGGTSSTGNGVNAYSFTNWNAATAYYYDLNGTWSSATNSTHFCLQQHMIYGLN